MCRGASYEARDFPQPIALTDGTGIECGIKEIEIELHARGGFCGGV